MMVYKRPTYPRDYRWGGKSEHRVFHAPVRKARRQHKNVVRCPSIRIDNFLQETLSVRADQGGCSIACRTSAAWIKRSVSSSSSHFESRISSGPVATVLRGPMDAVAISLPASAYCVQRIREIHLPTSYGKEITWYRNLLFESVE